MNHLVLMVVGSFSAESLAKLDSAARSALAEVGSVRSVAPLGGAYSLSVDISKLTDASANRLASRLQEVATQANSSLTISISLDAKARPSSSTPGDPFFSDEHVYHVGPSSDRRFEAFLLNLLGAA